MLPGTPITLTCPVIATPLVFTGQAPQLFSPGTHGIVLKPNRLLLWFLQLVYPDKQWTRVRLDGTLDTYIDQPVLHHEDLTNGHA